MYVLNVHYAGSRAARESHSLGRGSEVLTLIAKLLERHGGCERIAVYAYTTLLFAVDCNGARLAP